MNKGVLQLLFFFAIVDLIPLTIITLLTRADARKEQNENYVISLHVSIHLYIKVTTP